MFILRIKLTRIGVIIFKKLNFLPLSIKNKIAEFLENQTKYITKEMIKRKYI
ncbi:hypothetical protein H9660_05390 [Clostridium sp. Sa3CUN1]|uniref:Uncharacterized protein n=1 Tax=Clostridium gallinarum TaxID=2762246 RepID=A0ABR8Q2F2_9CLOT|nr:hypothetical protein [Clostridium gallinarum]MBD7914572.1 hypothetical protein [Clostridium gallinarum]